MRVNPLALCVIAWIGCGPLPPDNASEPRYAAAPGQGDDQLGAADYHQVNQPGEMIDIDSVAVPGKITVVELQASWCRACKYLLGRLVGVARSDSQIAIRTVDVSDMDTPIARRYGVWALPQVHIYDRSGRAHTVLRGRQAQSAPQIASDLAR
jgi:thiol-disulfide isomerase/thioredoxin